MMDMKNYTKVILEIFFEEVLERLSEVMEEE